MLNREGSSSQIRGHKDLNAMKGTRPSKPLRFWEPMDPPEGMALKQSLSGSRDLVALEVAVRVPRGFHLSTSC